MIWQGEPGGAREVALRPKEKGWPNAAPCVSTFCHPRRPEGGEGDPLTSAVLLGSLPEPLRGSPGMTSKPLEEGARNVALGKRGNDDDDVLAGHTGPGADLQRRRHCRA